VYAHRDTDQLLRQWSGERIHRGDELELYRVDRTLVAGLAAALARRMSFALSRTDGHLYVTVRDKVIDGAVERVSVPVG
jgi:hypothetical protein